MSTKVTETKTTSKSHYKWIEKNIARIGAKTYRIRVGSHDAYASTRDSARIVKRTLLNK